MVLILSSVSDPDLYSFPKHALTLTEHLCCPLLCGSVTTTLTPPQRERSHRGDIRHRAVLITPPLLVDRGGDSVDRIPDDTAGLSVRDRNGLAKSSHAHFRVIGNLRCVAACQTFRRERLQGDNGFRIEHSYGATHVVLLLNLLNCPLPRFLDRGRVSAIHYEAARPMISSLALPRMKIPCLLRLSPATTAPHAVCLWARGETDGCALRRNLVHRIHPCNQPIPYALWQEIANTRQHLCQHSDLVSLTRARNCRRLEDHQSDLLRFEQERI
jgi:hypothetical protein